MPPFKVFVSNVDRFVCHEVGRFLAQAAIGGTQAEDDEDDEDGEAAPKETYTVVGTLSQPDAAKPKWVSEVVAYDPTQKEESLKETLLGCDAVVWDITPEDEHTIDGCCWAVEMLKDNCESFESTKLFVCISTVLTWAKTRPADPEDTESPVLEEEYKRRRPHPRYRSHADAEKLVLKCGRKTKGKFKSYVTAAGVPYGCGEDVFHYLFRSAWHQTPESLPCFGDGQNVVPTIHATDLAGVVVNIIEGKPDTKYIVAADESRHTLSELTTCIAENLGTGRVKNLSKDDGLTSAAVTRLEHDMLLIDLRIEVAVVKDMNISWIAQTGVVENVQTVIAEYKNTRNLTPLRVCMLGAPAIGKTPYTERLCKHYKLHHVHQQGVIDEAIGRLKASVARLSEPGAEELSSDATTQAEEDRETLDQLSQQMAADGKYEDETVTNWFRDKLKTMQCLNQGYVLEGFPETKDQAEKLFAPGEDAEDQDAPDPLTIPEFVFSLDASDEFLCSRTMQLPEAFVAGTEWTEEGMKTRLADFRKQNDEENEGNVLNYFDFLEIHPYHVDVEGLDGFFEIPSSVPFDFSVLDDGQVMKKIVGIVGAPHNYGPTDEEKRAIERAAKKAAEEEAARVAKETAAKDEAEAELHAERQSKWEEKLSLVKQEESQALEASASPLRTFLMRHVMPTLTQGLVEVSNARPEDPVDFLAEYLFRNNPTPLIN